MRKHFFFSVEIIQTFVGSKPYIAMFVGQYTIDVVVARTVGIIWVEAKMVEIACCFVKFIQTVVGAYPQNIFVFFHDTPNGVATDAKRIVGVAFILREFLILAIITVQSGFCAHPY
ncbi:MAG: hypothetical protein WCQ41_08185, partial [Bacillota bacterium]